MNEHDELMTRITNALEKPPQVAAPADFSARLMTRLPSGKPSKRVLPVATVPSHYGRFMTLAMLALLLLGMVCAAVYSGHSTTWSLVEALLFLQFGALALWLVLSRQRVF